MKPGFFKATILLAPFFEFKNREKLIPFSPMFEELDLTEPQKFYPALPADPPPPNYTVHFYNDPIN